MFMHVPVMSTVMQAPSPSRGWGTKPSLQARGVCFVLLCTFLIVVFFNLPKCKHTHTGSMACSTPRREAGTVRKVHTKCIEGHSGRDRRGEMSPT